MSRGTAKWTQHQIVVLTTEEQLLATWTRHLCILTLLLGNIYTFMHVKSNCNWIWLGVGVTKSILLFTASVNVTQFCILLQWEITESLWFCSKVKLKVISNQQVTFRPYIHIYLYTTRYIWLNVDIWWFHHDRGCIIGKWQKPKRLRHIVSIEFSVLLVYIISIICFLSACPQTHSSIFCASSLAFIVMLSDIQLTHNYFQPPSHPQVDVKSGTSAIQLNVTMQVTHISL